MNPRLFSCAPLQIALILNPPSLGAVERIRGGVRRLRDAGHTVLPRLTFEAGDAERLALEAAAAGAELVVAGGGDGTVNEVANGLVAWGRRSPPADGVLRTPRLGIVPLGTGNDLAGGLRIPADPLTALALALVGHPYAVDVGTLNGRSFLNVSSGGLGAEATEEASEQIKRVLGRVAYVVKGVQKFVGLEPRHARFCAGTRVLHDGPFLLFAVGNGRRTGGGNWLTPRADLADGMLDVCIVGEMSHVDFLALAPELRSGSHLEHPKVIYRRVPSLRVEADEELVVNADGEPLAGGRTLDYGVAPFRLTLMVPEPPAEWSSGDAEPVQIRQAEPGARTAFRSER